MDREEILRKLNSQFSYLVAEIPAKVTVDGKTIALSDKIYQIVQQAELGDSSKVLSEVIELERSLSKLVSNFAAAVKNSKINVDDAESRLSFYLGIKRAITILQGILDGSLGPYRQEEPREKGEERKRWLDYARGLEDQ